MNSQPHISDIKRYAECFRTVSPAVLSDLGRWFTDDAHFVDPFNDVHGLVEIHRVFARMFETCLDIRFEVTRTFVDGEHGCMAWTMHFRPNVPFLRHRQWHIPGTSMLRFAPDGRILEHVDYWDSGKYFYARLPLLGAVIRLLQKRVA